MLRRKIALCLIGLCTITILTGCRTKKEKATSNKEKPEMTLIGHSSVKIKTAEGVVIYIDPFAEGDYSEEADIILVTHEHEDHNKVDLVTKKDTTTIITNVEALKDGKHNSFEVDGVQIESVEAENVNHPSTSCGGYILSFDNITFYHAGDTSYIDSMKDLTKRKLTYAMYPIDGEYNMDAVEATECANIVGAKYNIAMHTSSTYTYDEERVKNFTPEGKLEVPYGTTIELEAD